MKLRSQWQHDVDDACAESISAGLEFSEAKREFQEAQAEVERAKLAVAEAERAGAAAEAAVKSAREAAAAAQAELRVSMDSEERTVARAALTAAVADLADTQQQLSATRSALSQAQRVLSDAKRRLSDAEQAVSNAQSKVDRSKARLKELMELARIARSKSEDANVPGGPTRFGDHFEVARETWTNERIFFTNLIEQLEGSLGSLASAVENANRLRTFTGIVGSLSAGLSALGFGGGSFLPGFNMPSFGGAGLGFPPSIGARALPGMFPVPFSGGISTSCGLCTSPFNLRTPVSFPAFSTPPLPPVPPGLNTQPLPCLSTPALGAPFLGTVVRATPDICTSVFGGEWPMPNLGTTAFSPPLSLGTSNLTPALGSSLSAIPPPLALGTAGPNLGGLSIDVPYYSEWSTPMIASSGGGNFEMAPLVSSWEGQSGDMGGVFKGAGNSHFTFAPDDGGWHVTTEVPGIPGGYSERLDISDFGGGFAMDGAGFGGFDGGCGLCS